MTGQLKAAQSALGGFSSAASGSTPQIKALQQEIKFAAQRVQDLEAAVTHFNDPSKTLTNELAKEKAHLASLTAELNNAKQAANGTATANTNLGNTLAHVSKNTKTAQFELQGMVWRIRELGMGLNQLGMLWSAAFTVPLVAAGAAAVKFSSEFETAMTKVQTLSAVSAERVAVMSDEILKLAPVTGIGPKELADGLLVVTSTGLRGAEAMQILAESAKLSAIGLGDTKNIARAVTAAITAYGKENLSAATAAKQLYAAVVEGGAEADEFAKQLGRVMGTANQLGISFAEVVSSIATFTRVGVSSSEAVTALRGTMTVLLKPSEKAKAALDEIGMSIQQLRDNVRKNGLADALIDLVNKIGDNDDALGAIIPNVRALAGVMANAGSQAEAYRTILANVEGGVYDIDKAFQTTSETVGMRWNKFIAEAKVLAIQMGESLRPVTVALIGMLESAMKWVGEAVALFGKLPLPLQVAGVAFLGLVAAMGPLIVLGGQVAMIVSALIGVFGAEGLVAAITGAATWFRNLTAVQIAYNATASTTAFVTGPLRAAITGVGTASQGAALLVSGLSAAVTGIVVGAGIVLLVQWINRVKTSLENMLQASDLLKKSITNQSDAERVMAAYQAGLNGEMLKGIGITMDMVKAWNLGREAAGRVTPVFEGMATTIEGFGKDAKNAGDQFNNMGSMTISGAQAMLKLHQAGKQTSDGLNGVSINIREVASAAKQLTPAQQGMAALSEETKKYNQWLATLSPSVQRAIVDANAQGKDLSKLAKEFGTTADNIQRLVLSHKEGAKAAKEQAKEEETLAKLLQTTWQRVLVDNGKDLEAWRKKTSKESLDVMALMGQAGVELSRKLEDSNAVGFTQQILNAQRWRDDTLAKYKELETKAPETFRRVQAAVAEIYKNMTFIVGENIETIDDEMKRAGIKTRQDMNETMLEAERVWRWVSRYAGEFTTAEILKAWENFYKAKRALDRKGWTVDFVDAVRGAMGKISAALSEIGQLTGGRLAAFAEWFATVAKAQEAAFDSGEAFRMGLYQVKKGGDLTAAGMANLAVGIAGVGSAFMAATQAGGTFQKTISGALVGAQFGSAFGPIGAGIGALIGGIGGLFRGLFGGMSERLKAWKEGNLAIADMRAELLKTYGTMEMLQLAAKSVGVDIEDALRGQGAGGAAYLKKAMEELKTKTEELSSAMDKYGLTWKDMGESFKQSHIIESALELEKDFNALVTAGVPVEKVITSMSSALNKFLQDAITSGTGIPTAMAPILRQMIELGEITESTAALLLGMTDAVTPGFDDIKAAADRYGISLDSLGGKVKQIQINEEAAQIVKDFNLLIAAGADTGAVMEGMKDEVQALVTSALKLGLALPESMKPMIQSMIDAGMLTDAAGEKLTDLSQLKFEKPLTAAIDELIKKLDELIKKILDVGNTKPGTITFPWQWDGNTPPSHWKPGDPGDGTQSEPPGPTFASGTPGLTYGRFGSGTKATLHDEEAVIPRSGASTLADDIAAAMAARGGGGGGEYLPITLVMPDGEVLLKEIVQLAKDRGYLR